MDKEFISLLRNLLGSNGYADEFTGSWHRFVDAHEKLAEAQESIASDLSSIKESLSGIDHDLSFLHNIACAIEKLADKE